MEKLTLFMSLRSPFARRVRLILEETNQVYDHVVVDVFNLPATFSRVNPMGRVPVLQLASGECIVDSTEINQYLKERLNTHPLFDRRGASEARLRRITGLALGIMEYSVAAFLESLRPAGLAMPEMRADFIASIAQTLASLEGESLAPFLLGDDVSAWDLDVGTALAYCDLRIGRELVDRYPRLRAYLDRLNERASFKKTAPPA